MSHPRQRHTWFLSVRIISGASVDVCPAIIDSFIFHLLRPSDQRHQSRDEALDLFGLSIQFPCG